MATKILIELYTGSGNSEYQTVSAYTMEGQILDRQIVEPAFEQPTIINCIEYILQNIAAAYPTASQKNSTTIYEALSYIECGYGSMKTTVIEVD